MKFLIHLFLAFLVASLAACSNSSKFEGVWMMSVEKTMQANKDEAAKNPMYEFGLNIIKAAFGDLAITNNTFEIGLDEKRMSCTIDPSLEKDNVACVKKSDNKPEDGKMTITLVDGYLRLVGGDGKMILIFAKKDPNSPADTKASEDSKKVTEALQGLANMADAMKQPDAATPPAATEAAEAAPETAQAAAPVKNPSDTCAAGSKTLFSCMTEKGKRIELCDAGAKVVYSYGKPGASEINLAVDRGNATTQQWEGMGSNEYYSVNIPNGKTVYSVFTSSDHRTQEFSAGVEVIANGKTLATVNCAEGDALYGLEGVDLKKAE